MNSAKAFGTGGLVLILLAIATMFYAVGIEATETRSIIGQTITLPDADAVLTRGLLFNAAQTLAMMGAVFIAAAGVIAAIQRR